MLPHRPSSRCAILLPVICAALVANATPSAAATAHAAKTQAGTIVAVSSDLVTIQAAGRQTGVVNALTQTADAITAHDYPYVWGGGHAVAGTASAGEAGGPGYNGKRVGFDCSGSVAAVLEGAGLWPAGAGVPADNGVISELLSEGLIAKGAGTTATEVTLYDDPGVHIFMNIDGRFFGTSDGAGGGDRKGGAGWLDDGAWDATDPAFKRYHFLPSVLHASTTYGAQYTFTLPAAGLPGADLLAGESVRISYTTARTGEIDATAISFPHAHTTTGTVTAIGSGSFTVQTASGATVTIPAASGTGDLPVVPVGSVVTVLTGTVAGAQELEAITVSSAGTGTATAPGTTTTTATTTTTTDAPGSGWPPPPAQSGSGYGSGDGSGTPDGSVSGGSGTGTGTTGGSASPSGGAGT